MHWAIPEKKQMGLRIWNFQKIEMASGISTGYQEFAGALVLGLQIFGQIFEGVTQFRGAFRGEALFFLEHPGIK